MRATFNGAHGGLTNVRVYADDRSGRVAWEGAVTPMDEIDVAPSIARQLVKGPWSFPDGWPEGESPEEVAAAKLAAATVPTLGRAEDAPSEAEIAAKAETAAVPSPTLGPLAPPVIPPPPGATPEP